MQLKNYYKDGNSVSMSENVDWENEKISIEIKTYDSKSEKYSEYSYPAEEFSSAIKKFDELEAKFEGKEQPKDSLILIETLDDLKSEIETKGWRIEDIYIRSANSDGWELYQYSPAGQDFSFTILHNNDLETAVKEIMEYTEEGFDKDENIEMYIEARNNGFKGVPTTRELVQDADDIQNMLDSLNKHLSIDCVIHPSKDSVEVDKEDDLEPEM